MTAIQALQREIEALQLEKGRRANRRVEPGDDRLNAAAQAMIDMQTFRSLE
jgi:hypothetical protein